MRTVIAAAFVGLLLATPLAPAAIGSGVTIDRALDVSLLQRINEVRAEHSLPPLSLSRALSRAAAAHTREMATEGYFSHDSSDGSPFWQRVKRYYGSRGFMSWSVGENLVWGSPDLSSADALDAWLESAEHRANLLSRSWREVGLAAAHVADAPGAFGDGETTIVTADFGARSR